MAADARDPAGRRDAAAADVRRRALDAVGIGTWQWDVVTGEVVWDDTMSTVLGLAPGTFDGRIETWRDLIHPDDLSWLAAETAHAVAHEGGVIQYEYRMRRPDGTYGWVQVRGRVIGEEGGQARLVAGTLWDATRTRAATEEVGRALRHMSDGFVAVGRDWRITFVNIPAIRLLGPSRDLIGRVLWEVPAIREVPRLREQCLHAARSGAPAGFDAGWPDGERRYHLRLLHVPDGYAVYLTDVTDSRRREAERSARERAESDRAARIAELTTALTEAVTVRDVVAAIADRFIHPFGGTALIVWLVDGDRLRVVDAIGYSPHLLRLVDNLPLDAATAISTSFRARAPQFVASPGEFLARFPGSEDLVAASGKKSWAFLPLLASGRAVGAAVISFDRPRALSGEERALFTALSGLAGQALERARLYDVEHSRARELQRGLLPRSLPELPGVTAAARYLPAGHGADVGGDWYDVIPLSADRVALVIGDVMGHGLSEAATMGRLRTAVRTLSDLELPPDEIIGHLNTAVADLGGDFFATCLYAVYDPAAGTCVFARAGHPPPAVVRPDGHVEFPRLPPNAPLGAAQPPIDTGSLRLAPDSLLVLFTDGLVESAARDIDRGMAELAEILGDAVRRPGPADLDALCDRITGRLLPPGQPTADDAVLLVARLHPLAADRIATWPLPDDPLAAGRARDLVRGQLGRWRLEELVPTTELVASELVANAIRHAKAPIRLRLLRSRTLVCEVSDGSLTMPHVRRATETDEGGRGLHLVAAVAHRWGTRFTPGGKAIWTEQRLPGEEPGPDR